jgi:hypothetical protein
LIAEKSDRIDALEEAIRLLRSQRFAPKRGLSRALLNFSERRLRSSYYATC